MCGLYRISVHGECVIIFFRCGERYVRAEQEFISACNNFAVYRCGNAFGQCQSLVETDLFRNFTEAFVRGNCRAPVGKGCGLREAVIKTASEADHCRRAEIFNAEFGRCVCSVQNIVEEYRPVACTVNDFEIQCVGR